MNPFNNNPVARSFQAVVDSWNLRGQLTLNEVQEFIRLWRLHQGVEFNFEVTFIRLEPRTAPQKIFTFKLSPEGGGMKFLDGLGAHYELPSDFQFAREIKVEFTNQWCSRSSRPISQGVLARLMVERVTNNY